MPPMQPVLAIRTTLSGFDNIWEHDPENGRIGARVVMACAEAR